ncbi:MAG TPA: DUF2149 domain-containing protein [Solirubrobacteraceae bacterium]
MIEVKRRAQRHADRAGDPLDGLVNMFDLGIVLAVAFLIAGFSLSQLLTSRAAKAASRATPSSIAIDKNQKIVPVKPGQKRVQVANGARSLGQVYEDPDGQLVYVTNTAKP